MIRSLNLDQEFIPTSLTEIEFEMFKFGGGEIHIKLNNNIDYSNIDMVVITNRFKDGDDIIKVLIAKDALELKGIKNFHLVMPYIPYARQDRQCADGESLTLKVFSKIINNANFDKIHVIDAHSDVAPALLDKSNNISNLKYVVQAVEYIHKENNLNDILLISPDSGANKKSNKLFNETNNLFSDLIKCDKKRNLNNGSLSGFEIFADDLNKKDCLIVDDICSRGGTFIGIAKALKEKNAGNIYLFVTHYEGTANIEAMKEAGIVNIIKTNSMNDIQNDFVKQINIQL